MNALARQDLGPRSADGASAPPGRKVRVLFLNDTARNGGPGRSLHSILKFLDPGVVHRAVVLPRPGPVADLLQADGVVDELHFEPNLVENPIEPWTRPMERRDFDVPSILKGARLAGNVVKAARSVGRLAAAARAGRFDLVYCNGTNADFTGAVVAALTGVPALWHVRYTSVPAAAGPLHRYLSAGSRVARIVCVSEAAAGLFQHCPSKVRVIHNALDVESFDPERIRPTLRAELGLPAGAVVFGSHGRVLRRKGYVEMVRAARLALDRVPEAPTLHFVVVGDTPEDFRPDHVEQCRRLAADLGLGDRFRMLGFRSDVRPLVADFDVAVVPSVYPDPLPRAVIESMSLGKPVVAFGVGGVAEMMHDGVTGEVVRFDADGEGASAASVQRLADAFVRYAGDAALRQLQGEAARARILRDFDARSHARRIQAEILEAARSPEDGGTREAAS
jgi:glycosyltransferase involved in cell wall biosynthesis